MGKSSGRPLGAIADLVERARSAWRAGARRNARGAARRGRRAEWRAECLLRFSGCKVLTRNYKRRTGEIDLVLLDAECLVFVEVRYRGPGAWVSPLASVDVAKQRRLTRTAQLFLADHPEHRFRDVRFDIVCARKRHFGIACEWIPNAFEPMDT